MSSEPPQSPPPEQPPTPPPPLPPPPPPSAYGYPTRPNDGMAIAAVVVGILAAVGLFCYGVPAIILGPIAVFLGLNARRRIKASGGALGGYGLAQAGWITGLVAASLGLLVVIALIGFIVIFAVTGHSFPSPTP